MSKWIKCSDRWIKTSDHTFPKDKSFLCYRVVDQFRMINVVRWETDEQGNWEEGILKIEDTDWFFHPKYCMYWMPLPDEPKDKEL